MVDGSLRIRRYRPADRDVVMRLHRIGLAQVGLRPGDGVYYDDDLGRIEELYLRAGGDFLVGEVVGGEGQVVAMGAVRRVDEVTAEAVRLRVHPVHQRRGYGRAMLRAVERRAAELGYRTLRGDTTERQIAAIALYAEFGWREVGRRVVGEIVNIDYEKPLVPADREVRP
ncbi:MAG: GNAT family N-acetyltransferase [Streptosporangiales bacterium]|nr:GNAT family N-acetyltransferase [Streptosporangiales bacterium]